MQPPVRRFAAFGHQVHREEVEPVSRILPTGAPISHPGKNPCLTFQTPGAKCCSSEHRAPGNRAPSFLLVRSIKPAIPDIEHVQNSRQASERRARDPSLPAPRTNPGHVWLRIRSWSAEGAIRYQIVAPDLWPPFFQERRKADGTCIPPQGGGWRLPGSRSPATVRSRVHVRGKAPRILIAGGLHRVPRKMC